MRLDSGTVVCYSPAKIEIGDDMGVNAIIQLPADVRVRDVAVAMGLLAGLKRERCPLSGTRNSWYCKCPGAKVESTQNIPESPEIFLRGRMVDGEEVHHILFHYEPGDVWEGRQLNPPSTQFWIALGSRLCKFFGGEILFDDCKARPNNAPWYDRQWDKPRRTNRPCEDAEWLEFQEELFALEALTAEEITGFSQNSAYQVQLKETKASKSPRKKPKVVITSAELERSVSNVLDGIPVDCLALNEA